MKAKGKVLILTFILLYCLNPFGNSQVEAQTAVRTVYAPPNGTWIVYGTFTKSTTSNKVYATNYSGHGTYAYCYGHVRSNLSGTWVTYSSNVQLLKNDVQKTINLTNTIDAGKSISLRVTGAIGQTDYDKNVIKFEF